MCCVCGVSFLQWATHSLPLSPSPQHTAVKHTADDFEEGSTHILTLSDQRLLTATGDENTAEDALEDSALREAEKRRERQEAKGKKIGYDVAADLEGSNVSLLAQYDHDKKTEKR